MSASRTLAKHTDESFHYNSTDPCSIHILILEAQNLHSNDSTKLSSPVFITKHNASEEKSDKSPVFSRTIDPVANYQASLCFKDSKLTGNLVIKVLDSAKGGFLSLKDDFLGKVIIPLEDLKHNGIITGWFALVGRKKDLKSSSKSLAQPEKTLQNYPRAQGRVFLRIIADQSCKVLQKNDPASFLSRRNQLLDLVRLIEAEYDDALHLAVARYLGDLDDIERRKQRERKKLERLQKNLSSRPGESLNIAREGPTSHNSSPVQSIHEGLMDRQLTFAERNASRADFEEEQALSSQNRDVSATFSLSTVLRKAPTVSSPGSLGPGRVSLYQQGLVGTGGGLNTPSSNNSTSALSTFSTTLSNNITQKTLSPRPNDDIVTRSRPNSIDVNDSFAQLQLQRLEREQVQWAATQDQQNQQNGSNVTQNGLNSDENCAQNGPNSIPTERESTLQPLSLAVKLPSGPNSPVNSSSDNRSANSKGSATSSQRLNLDSVPMIPSPSHNDGVATTLSPFSSNHSSPVHSLGQASFFTSGSDHLSPKASFFTSNLAPNSGQNQTAPTTPTASFFGSTTLSHAKTTQNNTINTHTSNHLSELAHKPLSVGGGSGDSGHFSPNGQSTCQNVSPNNRSNTPYNGLSLDISTHSQTTTPATTPTNQDYFDNNNSDQNGPNNNSQNGRQNDNTSSKNPTAFQLYSSSSQLTQSSSFQRATGRDNSDLGQSGSRGNLSMMRGMSTFGPKKTLFSMPEGKEASDEEDCDGEILLRNLNPPHVILENCEGRKNIIYAPHSSDLPLLPPPQAPPYYNTSPCFICSALQHPAMLSMVPIEYVSQQPLAVLPKRRDSFLTPNAITQDDTVVPAAAYKLSLCCATMNVGNAPPSANNLLKDWLREDCDIYVIGTQENAYTPRKPYKTHLEDFNTTVLTTLGQEYELIHSEDLGQMHIHLVVKSQVKPYVDLFQPQHATCSTGLLNGTLPNKGGVCLALSVFGTNFCFLSSHLAAHTHKKAKRDEDMRSIVRGINFHGAYSQISILNAFHHVFWLGDLNYRCLFAGESQKPDPIKFDLMIDKIRSKTFDEILLTDQLLFDTLENKTAFVGFNDSPIEFPPTFKVKKGQFQEYDTTRTPSYCDRILYKSQPGFEQQIHFQSFDSAQNVTSSDHKPVSAIFNIYPSVPVPALSCRIENVTFTLTSMSLYNITIANGTDPDPFSPISTYIRISSTLLSSALQTTPKKGYVMSTGNGSGDKNDNKNGDKSGDKSAPSTPSSSLQHRHSQPFLPTPLPTPQLTSLQQQQLSQLPPMEHNNPLISTIPYTFWVQNELPPLKFTSSSEGRLWESSMIFGAFEQVSSSLSSNKSVLLSNATLSFKTEDIVSFLHDTASTRAPHPALQHGPRVPSAMHGSGGMTGLHIVGGGDDHGDGDDFDGKGGLLRSMASGTLSPHHPQPSSIHSPTSPSFGKPSPSLSKSISMMPVSPTMRIVEGGVDWNWSSTASYNSIRPMGKRVGCYGLLGSLPLIRNHVCQNMDLLMNNSL